MRREARFSALQFLYQLDVHHLFGRCASEEMLLEKELQKFWESFPVEDKGQRKFATRLIRGVIEKFDSLDEVLQGAAQNWRLERMESVDRNLLRMAAFELLYCDDIPRNATINEAIELAKSFGGKKSSGFINGILDQISSPEIQTSSTDETSGV